MSRPSVTGVWPPRPTWEQLSIAGLSSDGLVQGWVKVPVTGIWQPQEGDVLWHPPTATKAVDVDRAAGIVDVVQAGDIAWVRAQLDKRNRYLELLREKVRSGAMKLDAVLAQWLGLPWVEDGAALTPRRSTSDGERVMRDLRTQLERVA